MQLSKSQRKAATHFQGPCLCLAGPGSGKTTVITERTKYLIEEKKVNPSNILVITFTKAAAVEMKDRFCRLMGERQCRVTFGTFHAVFFSILKAAYHYTAANILKEEEKYQLLKEITAKKDLEIEDEAEFLNSLIAEISLIKNDRIALEHYYSKNCSDGVFRDVYREYQEKLAENGKLDFDDMLVYTYELLTARDDILTGWQKRFSNILIDEFQDINAIQYEIIKLLAKDSRNLFIVGDDDQSIYRFRGARPEIMLNFQKDYPDTETVILEENYRSTERIIVGAGRVIKNNASRYPKKIHGNRGEGERITLSGFGNQSMEATALAKKVQEYLKDGTDPQNIAVLFRTNTGARLYVEKFMEFHIPFQMADIMPNIYEHWISRDILTYLRMAAGSRERKDFLAIINRPNRYIGREALEAPVISFQELIDYYEGKDWMAERVEKLEYDLQILSKMKPFAAINYIRKSVGYDSYLKDYAGYRKMKPEELYELLDELQEASKPYDTLDAWQEHMREYKEALKEQAKKKQQDENAVVFTTLHSAKGLEFPIVFLVDVNESNMPHKKALLDADIQEERRLFYVGMTRAKDKLYLYYAKERYGKSLDPSRFIEELKKSG